MKQVNVSTQAIEDAVFALKEKGIVVLPTQRWYMVCTLADNDDAIKRIFLAKQRALHKQLMFVLPTTSSVNRFFSLNENSRKLIDGLWPGDLCLLLNWSNNNISTQYQAMGLHHALANSPSGILGKVAAGVDSPLAATTVNVSLSIGHDKLGPAVTASEAGRFIHESGLQVDLVINGGISPAFNHTTILDCRDQIPKMVREGYVHKRAINAAIGYELL